MKSNILSAVSSYNEEMAEFTRDLVSIPTENPPGHFYRDCVEAIGRKLGELGLTHEIHEVPAVGEKKTSLPRFWVESFHGEGKRTLYFHGHYDVVPASGEDQFRPYIEGGRLIGRGAADMKSGLAAMIYAIRALKECRVPLHGRIGLTIVPDEETGGHLGTRYLSDHGLLGRGGIGMLTAEPTSGAVWNASRGAISLLVKIKGRPVHVGLQHQGVNAFEKMIGVAGGLLELKTEVESRETAFLVEPETARKSILMMGGFVRGGDNFNVVPGACTFSIDRRINPEENLAEEKKRLFDLFDKFRGRGVDIEVETIQEGVSAGVSEDSDLAGALASSIEEVTGRPARFELCPGLLETRFYAKQGVPALAYGPGHLSTSHGPGEYLDLRDLTAAAAVYALTAVRLLSMT